MSSNESDTGAPPEAPSHVGAIVLLGIVALGVIWTYIFIGETGLKWWGKGAATVVIFPTMFWAWRWRQKRINKQIEVLQRWADEDGAKSEKRRRKRV